MATKPTKKPAQPEPGAIDQVEDAADAADAAAQDALKAEAQETERTVKYDGVTYVLEPSYDDLELVEALADLDAGNRLAIPQIVERLIGPEQYAEFKVRYRDPETGKVPFSPMRELFYTIDTQLGE